MAYWISLWLLAGAAATFDVGEGVISVTVLENGSSGDCYRLDPGATFQVSGPAEVALQVWVDLPAKPKRPRPVRLYAAVDGKGREFRVNPRRSKVSGYEPAGPLAPSAGAIATKLRLPEGDHELSVTLPKRRSGCIRLDGLSLRPPPPPVDAAAAEALARATRVRALLDQVDTQRREGDDHQAIVLLRQVQGLDPDNAVARAALVELEPRRRALVASYLERANEHFLRQDLASAAKYYQRVLELEPDNQRAQDGVRMYDNLRRIHDQQQ